VIVLEAELDLVMVLCSVELETLLELDSDLIRPGDIARGIEESVETVLELESDLIKD
jgi:hypothetical protein